jgi:hypothetical protein
MDNSKHFLNNSKKKHSRLIEEKPIPNKNQVSDSTVEINWLKALDLELSKNNENWEDDVLVTWHSREEMKKYRMQRKSSVLLITRKYGYFANCLKGYEWVSSYPY